MVHKGRDVGFESLFIFGGNCGWVGVFGEGVFFANFEIDDGAVEKIAEEKSEGVVDDIASDK